MSKKKTHKHPQTKNYYELHTDAIDRLVNATDDNVPEVGAEEISKYESSVLAKIPSWIKAIFIKFWFNGAICFFFVWGLGTYIANYWNLLLITGLAMGAITDLVVNNIFRFTAAEDHDNDKWMLFPQKKFWTLFANIVYAFAVLGAVVGVYTAINSLFGKGEIVVGVEPFLFGLFYLLVDLCVIGLRNLITKAIRNAKRNKNIDETKLD